MARNSTTGRGRATGPRLATAPDIALSRVRRRRASVHGWAVFALEDIPKNRRILPYLGELISHRGAGSARRATSRSAPSGASRLDSRWVVDAHIGGNDARFINHSCTPNCYAQIVDRSIWIRAARTIRKGEELSYNYHTDGHGLITCRCRPGCTGRL